MSDQPQHPEDGQEEDILDRIINKSPAYSSPDEPSPEEPDGDAPNGPAPPQPVSERKAAADDRKNKRSSVYIYLLVLFGAAFLMLLLAYFVQQRNSETTISDLRNSMNLSREELLDEIDELKEEKETLEAKIQSMEDAQKEAEDWRDFLEQQLRTLDDEHIETSFNLDRTTALSFLERFCAEEDWLMAACVVEDCDNLFNAHTPEPVNAAPPPAGLAERYFQLREDVLEKAGSLVAERTYSDPDNQEHYSEQVSIDRDASRYGGEAVEAARLLWQIIWLDQHMDNSQAAMGMAEFSHQEQYRELLDSRAFRPSTVELFQQVKDQLIGWSLLEEHEDGTLILAENDGAG